ncbi:hypothetical protein IFM89_023191 [Coptis chinensis]|uniref:CCHC-type domain-containing protein n=1 Tax=Coptis chinensis TaxID=261450 RepID=A0A835HXE6_9MAGN|nr:hypothetical protein IFM89_023191 [Coptis chinensis]
MAFATTSNFQSHFNRGRGPYRGRGRGISFHRGSSPHQQNYTAQRSISSSSGASSSYNTGSSSSSNYNGARPICQICNKPGHLAIDCYNRVNHAYMGRHPPTKL